MVRRYFSCFSGVSATPSKSPSEYPFTVVIGVFKSWAILLISSLFSRSLVICCSADSFKRLRISSKLEHSSLISSLPSPSIVKSRLPCCMFTVAASSFFKGRIMPPYIQIISIAAVHKRIKKTEINTSKASLFISGRSSYALVTIKALPSSPLEKRKSTCLIRACSFPSIYMAELSCQSFSP